MRTKLLISFIAAMLTLASPALAYERDGAASDQASDEAPVVQPVDEPQPDRESDQEPDDESDRPVRDVATDELTRRCLDADKITDRCCAHFADENPDRCRDHICKDTDVLSDRCCHYFAADHPERCRDRTCTDADVVTDRCCHYFAADHPERCRDHDTPNYRALFWRLFKAGEWELIIRLLHHLEIV